MGREFRSVLAAALALAVAGCISTKGNGSREVELQAAQVGLEGPSYTTPTDEWWRSLGDPQLDLARPRIGDAARGGALRGLTLFVFEVAQIPLDGADKRDDTTLRSSENVALLL